MKRTLLVLLVFLCVACAAKYTAGVDAVVEEDTKRYVYYATDNDGKPITGIVRGYYKSGKLKYEALFKDGKQDGIEKGYYESGNLKYECFFKDGIREGVGKGYYENGQLESEAPYKNGKLEGITKFYYENGQLRAEASYKDGLVADDIVKGYNENGQLEQEVYYKYGRKIQATPYKDGEKEGREKHYHLNGKLAQETPFINGKINGTEYRYYENGNLMFKTLYKDGLVVDGIRTQCYPQKDIFGRCKEFIETPFKNGKIEGKEIEHHLDNSTARETSYKNGKKEGTEYRYYEVSSLGNWWIESTTPFKDGKEDGIQKYYHENGEQLLSLTYEKGELIRSACKDGREFNGFTANDLANWLDFCRTQFSEHEREVSIKENAEGILYATYKGIPITGTVYSYTSETKYKNGKIEGLQKRYYAIDHRLLWEASYKDGKQEGIKKQYFGNGDLWFSAAYKGGELVSGVCGNGKKFTSASVANIEPDDLCRARKYILEELSVDIDAEDMFATYQNTPITGTIMDYYSTIWLMTLVTIWIEIPFKNGKVDGVEKIYFEDGTPKSIAPYKNGKLEGIAKEYYQDGQPYSVTPYKNNKIDGIEKYYDEDGQLLFSFTYKNGKRIHSAYKGKGLPNEEADDMFSSFMYYLIHKSDISNKYNSFRYHAFATPAKENITTS